MTLDDFITYERADVEEIGESREGIRVRLRPFQEEAYRAWMERGCRGTIIAPTGTGKTIIAGYAIKVLDEPTLIVCPTERILKMWIERLREKFGIVATPYYGQVKRLSKFTVSIYNTVSTHLYLLDRFKMIVFDEVHHVASDTFKRILGRIGNGHRVMGLTATLKREDGKHLNILSKLPVVYCLDLREAVEDKLVAPVNVVAIPVKMNEREAEEYRRVEREIARLKHEAVMVEDGSERERIETLIKKKINERRQILSRLEAKREAVYRIALRHPDQRILVFSESIESIERLKRYLIERGVKAETYHSQKPEHVRDSIFKRWGSDFKLLLSCRALDEGVDVPEVGIAVVIASGLSVRQLVQRKGRIMRPRKGKTAILYVVYAQGSIEAMLPMKIRAILRGYVRLY